jgi:hypothetical protein
MELLMRVTAQTRAQSGADRAQQATTGSKATKQMGAKYVPLVNIRTTLASLSVRKPSLIRS